jgi:hypothetical protein
MNPPRFEEDKAAKEKAAKEFEEKEAKLAKTLEQLRKRFSDGQLRYLALEWLERRQLENNLPEGDEEWICEAIRVWNYDIDLYTLMFWGKAVEHLLKDSSFDVYYGCPSVPSLSQIVFAADDDDCPF